MRFVVEFSSRLKEANFSQKVCTLGLNVSIFFRMQDLSGEIRFGKTFRVFLQNSNRGRQIGQQAVFL